MTMYAQRTLRQIPGALRSSRSIASNNARSVRRWQSTKASSNTAHFWSTGRVLLFGAFTGTLTYLYGISDASSHLKQHSPSGYATKPVYAKKGDLERAITELRQEFGEDAISTDDEVLRDHGYSE